MMAETVDVGTQRRLKSPHTTLEKISKLLLPGFIHDFLFSRSCEFRVVRFFLGALFGAVSGAGLFLGLFHKVPMSLQHRLLAGCVFVVICILGGALSSRFRCSTLLTFPSMLGSRGRAYVMLFILSGLYSGPISNIQHNVQDIAFSMGCNVELQIQHSKVMWRVAMEPFMLVVQDIVDDTGEFQGEAKNINRMFQNIRDEVMDQYGYDSFKPQLVSVTNSTQDKFVTKTMMQCDYVVEQGVERCREWFQDKWQECMDTIKAPLINHVLCVSMRFHFLCDIMRVMTPWCREELPVEGNFGQVFDELSSSIDMLSREFSTNVVLQNVEQRPGVSVSQEEFTRGLRRSFQQTKAAANQLLGLIQLLLSFTFLTILTSAFGYARQFTQDIRFDNIYITRYFRQIDARRRRAGKRYLLPLKKAERGLFINPWSLSIHPSELKEVTLGLLQVLSLGTLACVLLALDMMLFHVFDIIGRHVYTEISLTSSHHIDIQVDGDSMMARMLRRTIKAFNSSSSLDIQTSNRHCLPQPRALTIEGYVWSTVPLLVMALMCLLQVYSNRLRRVIAAFYFPKREKRRALFLYNLQIQRHVCYVARQRRRLLKQKRTQRMASDSGMLWLLEKLGCRLQWCCVCGERQSSSSSSRGTMRCSAPACQALFCTQCWRDLDMSCPLCGPYGRDGWSSSESDDVYYVH